MKAEISRKALALAVFLFSLLSLFSPRMWLEALYGGLALFGAAKYGRKEEISLDALNEGIRVFFKALVVGLFASLLLWLIGMDYIPPLRLTPLEIILSLSIAPFAEELFFRAAIIDSMGEKWGAVASPILFSIAHASLGLAEAYGAFAIGLLFALEYVKKKRVFPLAIAHLLINALSLFSLSLH